MLVPQACSMPGGADLEQAVAALVSASQPFIHIVQLKPGHQMLHLLLSGQDAHIHATWMSCFALPCKEACGSASCC